MKALVLGGAACVWNDVRASEERLGGEWWDLVVAANDIGCHWPGRLDHWCSLHPERFTGAKGWLNPLPGEHGWKALRRENGHPDGYLTWAKRTPTLVDKRLTAFCGGSSGMLAVLVAREVGATQAVLCGMPMDRSGHFAESTVHAGKGDWPSADSHWRAWKRNYDKVVGWCRSMSGRTRILLGPPDAAWLEAA